MDQRTEVDDMIQSLKSGLFLIVKTVLLVLVLLVFTFILAHITPSVDGPEPGGHDGTSEPLLQAKDIR
jgi:hypothetical protein